ncbi:MAG: 4Fe-4S binding protein, partial [Armatimonadota bacterium]
VEMPRLSLERRVSGFDEVELGYDEAQAMAEASRCLHCGTCVECMECVKLCTVNAIKHDMEPGTIEVEVGSIIIATGFSPFDARRARQYGYGIYDNVLTSLEFERLSHASGPTGGKILLKDGREPGSVAIIHCVGSRDENYNQHCSRVCCMYAMKFAHLVREKTDAQVYEFYIDIRAFGKGYEEFYDRLMSEDVIFIRGKGAEVTDAPERPEEEGKLIVKCEDTLLGIIRRVPVDMVLLAVGLEPREDAEQVAKTFSLSCSDGGFFLELHPKLAPVATSTDGIFIAGACQGPKDIPDTVAQGAAAAAEALSLIDAGSVTIEPITSVIDEDLCAGCKTCIELCPYAAIEFNEEKGISEVVEALCKGCGTCVAACPAGAAHQRGFDDQQIVAEIEGAMMAF